MFYLWVLQSLETSLFLVCSAKPHKQGWVSEVVSSLDELWDPGAFSALSLLLTEALELRALCAHRIELQGDSFLCRRQHNISFVSFHMKVHVKARGKSGAAIRRL